MSLRITSASLTLAFLLAAGTAAAQITPPDTIYWRTDCTGYDPNVCFESPDDDLNLGFFVATPFVATADSPLLIEVGPGTFNSTNYYASYFCVHNPAINWVSENITVRGAGPGVTIIGDDDVDDIYAMELDNCPSLHFENLTVKGPIAVWWNGGGRSTWENVELIGDTRTWVDNDCSPGGIWPFTERAVHYWWGSIVRTLGAGTAGVAVDARCSEHWFYGSEISALGNASSSSSLASMTSIKIGSGGPFVGDVRLFGSAVRTGSGSLPASHAAFSSGTGVSVSGGGQFHMHGGIINTTSSGVAGADATGLSVTGSGSLGHTPDTAFVVKAGSGGTATRVAESAGGTALSPFLWQAGTAPPVPALQSVEGADMYVEYDCGSDGNCDAGGTQAHIMVYNPTECATELWFDSTTGRCRNDTTP